MAYMDISAKIEKIFEDRLKAIAKDLEYSDEDLKVLIQVNRQLFNTTAPTRTRKPKDHSETETKAPINGYVRYCNEMRPIIKSGNPDLKNTEIMKILADQWKEEDQSVKDKYNNQYKEDKKKYDLMMKAKKQKMEQTEETEEKDETDETEETAETEVPPKKTSPPKPQISNVPALRALTGRTAKTGKR